MFILDLFSREKHYDCISNAWARGPQPLREHQNHVALNHLQPYWVMPRVFGAFITYLVDTRAARQRQAHAYVVYFQFKALCFLSPSSSPHLNSMVLSILLSVPTGTGKLTRY